MSKNLLPKELESEYAQYHNYFDYWHINFDDTTNKTNFYVLGKWKFSIQGELSPEKIIEYMNNFEWIYKNAFDDGVKQTQSKIKSALGLHIGSF